MRSTRRRGIPKSLAAAVSVAVVSVSLPVLAVLGLSASASAAGEQIRITEWAYNGSEFFELTNVGPTAADLTDWTYSDSAGTDVPSPTAQLDLSPFGTVAAGESVVVSEATADAFRTAWGLAAGVKVIGGNTVNLGRSDAIKIYDATDVLVDSLTYDDQGTGNVAGPRTDTSSAWVSEAALGADNASLWTKSTLADAEGSWESTTIPGFFGSPGTSTFGGEPPAVPGDGVVLNEVHSNPNPDFVELLNTSDAPVDITGWTALDDDPAHAPLVFTTEPTVLDPGEYFAFDPNAAVYGAGAFGLGGNDEITIMLADGATVVDHFTWEGIDAPGGHADPSYGRCPDGTGDLVLNLSATRAAANDCPVPTEDETIRINEIESNGDVVGDWVELTNIGSAPVDVSGWLLRDSAATNPSVAIPGGTTIAPGAFVAIYTEIPPPGFGLGTDDEVTLYRPDGTTVVDHFAWSGGHAATTYGRCPDGTGDFRVTTVGTRGGPNACSPIRLNEIRSNPNPDAVEIVNISASPVDIAGWVVKDSGDADPTVLPSPSVVPAHGYLVLEPLAGLGSSDSVRLYDASAALVDSVSWTEHPLPSLGRCADGVGAFKLTASATFGATNDCPGVQTEPWPGSQTVTVSDDAATFNADASGLAFDPASPGTLWVAQNKLGTLWKLHQTAGTWLPAAGWEGGKTPRFADGTGHPDTEGVTVGPDGAVYLTTERDNDISGVSRNTVLRFNAASATGAELTPTDEWAINPLLPSLGANLGIEGITWVPDSFLTGGGFVDQSTGAAYLPATYPAHGTGLYVIAVEGTGLLYVLALDQTAAVQETAHLVATVDPRLLTNAGPPGAMDVSYDPELKQLWAVCDDSCDGTTSVLELSGGAFSVQHAYERPAGMPNLNNEGFALAPQSTCVAGTKEVVWSDDGDTDGHSLRSGTYPCTVISPPPPPPPPPAPVPANVFAGGGTVVYGQGLTIPVTVTASGVDPTGTVTLLSGATPLASGALSAGTASLTLAAKALPPGTHGLTVAYGGSSAVLAASRAIQVTVLRAGSEVAATHVRPQKVRAKTTKVKIEVAVTAAGLSPSGTVTLKGAGIDPVTGTLRPDGTVALKLGTFDTAGVKRLRLTYSGDTYLAGSTSKLKVTVLPKKHHKKK